MLDIGANLESELIAITQPKHKPKRESIGVSFDGPESFALGFADLIAVGKPFGEPVVRPISKSNAKPINVSDRIPAVHGKR